MDSPYVIPIIPYNLRKHETLIQIADVLDHLSNVTDTLLKRVSDRIAANDNKLTDISNRIEEASSKVKLMTGAKKAIQVFSSSKYPAAEIHKPYVSVFADLEPLTIKRHKVKHKNFPSQDEPLEEKLHVYHVKTKCDQRKDLNGLGDIPNDIACVNDLLLYNSGKNLYQDFVMSDALDFQNEIKEEQSSEVADIEPAPYSISERSTMTKSTTQPYFYNPNLGEVPTLDVPLDLPDLPGIADDLRYQNEIGPGIAPSVSAQHIADLPSFDQISTTKVEEPPAINLPPPPQPPPNVETNTVVPEKIDKVKVPEPPKVIETPVENGVKLPPAPPPIQDNIKIDAAPSPVSSGGIDAHASLMEAIRKAGGAKNAKLKNIDNSIKEEKKPATGGGDLMADLHAKLSMRRKGISGTKKNDGGNIDANTTMERISAMIPPPEPKSDLNDSTNTDDDWDE